jgi:SH3-like domain-containing protein
VANGGYDAQGNLVSGVGVTAEGRCIAEVESALEIGMEIVVTENNGNPLALRAEPSTLANRVAYLEPGTLATVVDGAFCGLGNGLYLWWEVETVDGLMGFVAEGDAFRNPPLYFVEPVALSDPIAFDPLNCTASVPSLVEVGDLAVVNEATNTNLRIRDRAGGTILLEVEPGAPLRVTGGPECAEGANFKWWQVRTEDGTIGWAAEGDGFQTDPLYFFVPEPLQGIESGRLPFDYGCPASPLSILKLGDVVEVADNGGQPLNFRSSPGGDVTQELPTGVRLEIVGGPTCEDLFHWWQVRSAEDEIGWIAEGDAFQTVRWFIRLAEPDDALDDLGFEPQTSRCGSAPLPMLLPGDTASVTDSIPGDTLPMRSSPFDVSVQLGELEPHDFLITVDDLICGEDGQGSYWLVRNADGDFGWVSEGGTTETESPYYIARFDR